MKLILKAYAKQSELLFELVQDADVSIGILIILESDQGLISGGISLDGKQSINSDVFNILSNTSQLTAQFIVDTNSETSSVVPEVDDPNCFYLDSGGGFYNDRTYAGKLFISAMLVQNVSGGISFVSSIVERNDKVSLKYDHYIDEVSDPHLFVKLQF